MQSGVPQATIPVQIPISTAGGQTVLQTIPFPVQIPVIPNVVQANGQTLQVMPQLAQVRPVITVLKQKGNPSYYILYFIDNFGVA